MLGITVSFPVMLVAVALGAGEPLRGWPWLQETLRWIGAAYLLWLAWRVAIPRPEASETGPTKASRPLTFIQAAPLQWVNPKAWVIAAGAVVTYTTEGSAVLAQAAALAAVFLLITLPTTALWTGVGVDAARILSSPRALWAFNLAMAALLIASQVPLLNEGTG
jgi:threonine/homoserine/homoserine lactone efflux protein